MPPAAAIGASAAAPAVGSLIGNLASQGSQSQAQALSQQALQNIMGVNTPTVAQMQLALKQYQNAGNLTPAQESAVSLGQSNLNNISTDPKLAQAQMQALTSLQQQGQGGLKPQDVAALAQARNAANQNAQAGSAAVLQNMQARGIGGSGAELAAQLSNSQNAANQANQNSLSVGANATQNALNAIAQAGNLGNNMQQSNFNQAATVANANDVINKYNAMNTQDVNNQNTAVNNAAQAQNLANQQSLMNQNTELSNYQNQYNTNLYQQDYNNQMQKATAASGQDNQLANYYTNQAAQTQSMYGGLGQAAGSAAGAVGQYNANNAYLDKQNTNNMNYLNTLLGKSSTPTATNKSTSLSGSGTIV